MNMFCSRCQVEFPIEERKKHFYGRKHMLCETESEILRLLDELAKKMSGERKHFIRFMQEDIMDSFQRLASDAYFKERRKKMTKKFSRLVASLESEEIEDMVLANVEPVHLEDYKSGKLKYSWQRR